MPLKTLISWFLCLAVLPLSAQRHRRFDPETDVSLEFRKGAVVVEAPAGAHLKGAFMAVKLKEGAKGTLKVGPLPATNAKDELGDGIWHGPVVIPVKGEGLSGQVDLVVTYQPCTEGEGGVCYPPTDRVLTVKASDIPTLPRKETPKAAGKVEAPAAEPAPNPLPEAAKAPVPSIAHTLPSGLLLSLLFIFLAGLAASLTPCVLPMIPITMAIIGAKGGGKWKGFLLSFVLVQGMAVTYTVLGVIAASTGAAAGSFAQRPAFLIPASLLFTIFAISLFGAFEIKLPDSLTARLQGSGPRRGYLGAFVMGLVLGPLSAPCVGPIIGSVLVDIAVQGQVGLGALKLFLFAQGMGVLFILAGTAIASLPRSGDWLIRFKQFLGFLVLGYAVWMLRLIIPGSLRTLLYALTCLIGAGVFGVFEPAAGILGTLRRAMGIALLLSGLLLGLRGVELALGVRLLPSQGASESISRASTQSRWMEQDLEGALVRARAEKKLVLVDVYAEWCAQCKELDEKTWPDPKVAAWIEQNAIAVRVDADGKRPDLAKKLGILGYPTILVLDPEGQVLRRLEGFQKPEDLLAFLGRR